MSDEDWAEITALVVGFLWAIVVLELLLIFWAAVIQLAEAIA